MIQAQLYLFGAPRLEKDGRSVELDTRKALALLAYLALSSESQTLGGRPTTGSRHPAGHTRDALAALFYPESDQASARAALRRTLSPLRKTLDETCLEAERDRLSLQPDCLWVDVLAFRQALAETRTHEHRFDQLCPSCLPPLEQAADLYREGFMAGFSLRDSAPFDDWQYFQGEALRQEMAQALEKLATIEAALGNFEQAQHYSRRWLALDTLSEEAQRRAMFVFAWSGQRNAALRQYRECVRILDRELGVAPLEETTQLYQQILENKLPERPTLQPAPVAKPAQPAPTAQPLPLQTQPPVGAAGFAGGGKEAASGSRYPLVGRDAELHALRQAHQKAGEAAAGGRYLLALEGEAGIGKTRLAEEFIGQLRAGGTSVIQARCYEGEANLEYAPFLEALNGVMASEAGLMRLQSLPVHQLAPAAQLFPVLYRLSADWLAQAAFTAGSGGALTRLFEALRLILTELLRPEAPDAGPGVLLLDDLHWADEASLDLLSYLVRRLQGGMILVAWHSDAVASDHRIRRLLAQAARDGKGESVRLERLHPQDVRQMVLTTQSALPEQMLGQLMAVTDGNPYFLVQYLREIHAAPGETQAAASSERAFLGEIPVGVQALLRSRLAGLDAVSAQLLGAAAVIGRAFDEGILREVSGRSELETIEGLERLLGRGLLVGHHRAAESGLQDSPAGGAQSFPGVASAAGGYDFSHDTLRSYVYEETSQARRRLLHQRAADWIARQPRQPREFSALAAQQTAAQHYKLAGQLSQAAEYFFLAGKHARQVYANRDALAHFQQALACGYERPAEAHEAIGDLLALQGEYTGAVTSYETAAALCPDEHLPGVEHKLGKVQHSLGRWELAEYHFQAALDQLAGHPAQAESARIHADWSLTAYRRENLAHALELAEKALALASQSEDPLAVAQAHNMLGLLERSQENLTRARQHLEHSLALAEQVGEAGAQTAALNNLARLLAQEGQYETARRLTRVALELCEKQGDRHRTAALHNNLADLYHADGQTEQAMEHLKQAVAIFAEVGFQAGDAQAEIWMLAEW